MKEDLKTIKEQVKGVLEECPKARDSDLIGWIIANKRKGVNIYISDINEVINFESFRRCRQKLQEENDDLRGSEYIEKERKKRERQFKKEFGKHD